MRRPRPSTLSALVLAIALAFVGSTSAALYLGSLGPKECCKSHCHRGKSTSDADADRCCTTHLGVLPSALAAKAPDLQHAFAAVGTAVVAPVLPAPALVVASTHAPVALRGSPPGSLVARHVTLLI